LIVGAGGLISTQPLTIRCITVRGVRRIAAQRGVFFELSAENLDSPFVDAVLWYVLDFMAHKWCFFRANHQFVDEKHHATQADLFPSDGMFVRAASLLMSRS